MKIRAHGATDIGLVRTRNEDNLLVDLENGVFAVADGIGGMPGGEVASATAVRNIADLLARDARRALADPAGLVQQVNAAVRRAGASVDPAGIGTTLTLAHIEGALASIAHVGDSFALLVRGGRCRALTREHNVENETDNPMMLAPHPPRYRYALTRALGQPVAFDVDVLEEVLKPGDRLVLCTDGLTDMLEFFDIARICTENPAPERATAALIAAALEAGGSDNITVIVVAAENGG